jgi:hypothetical protein
MRWCSGRAPARTLALLLAAAVLTAAVPSCKYNGSTRWSKYPTGVFVKPCSATDATQRWLGSTLATTDGSPSPLTNAGAHADVCLGTLERDPIMMEPCSGAKFLYNHSNRTIAVVGSVMGGKCLDLNHGTGPDIDFWACHDRTSPDAKHQQFDYNRTTGQLRPVTNSSLCLSLNRSKVLPYITPPCVWPSGTTQTHNNTHPLTTRTFLISPSVEPPLRKLDATAGHNSPGECNLHSRLRCRHVVPC